MKRLILAAGLFAATLTASLHAQTMDMKANIPFDFRIGNAAFPSGEYSVRNSGGVLSQMLLKRHGFAYTDSLRGS
jgi:hypothetical protein